MCLGCVYYAVFQEGVGFKNGAIEEIDKPSFFDLNYQLDCF